MEEKELIINDGKIRHDIMAHYLMAKYTFKTFSDTDQILVFSKKKGYYTTNSITTIKRAIHKALDSRGLSTVSRMWWKKESAYPTL